MAQLYVHHPVSAITQPVIQLKGFERFTLKPGQKKTVEFKITPDLLAIYGPNMRRAVRPGPVELRVGSSSTQTISANLQVTGS